MTDKKRLRRFKPNHVFGLTFAFCVLLISFISCSTTPNVNNIQESTVTLAQAEVHESKELSIEFEYPSNWALDEGEGRPQRAARVATRLLRSAR